MAVANRHTCVRLDDGEVRCRGGDNAGALGNGLPSESVGDNETPDDIAPLPFGYPIRDFDLGLSTGCALTEDGGVLCWGLNNGYNLGLGDDSVVAIGDDESVAALDQIDLGL